MLCRIPFGADEETKNEGYSVSGSITISTLPAISMTFAFAQAFVSTSSGEFDVSAFRIDVGALLGHVATFDCKRLEAQAPTGPRAKDSSFDLPPPILLLLLVLLLRQRGQAGQGRQTRQGGQGG